MNDPDDVRLPSAPLPEGDDSRWKHLLAQARPVPIPRGFAARMQALADARDAAGRADDWLIRGLLLLMTAAGLWLAGPDLWQPLLASLRPLAELAPWWMPAVAAMGGSWLLDRVLHRAGDAAGGGRGDLAHR